MEGQPGSWSLRHLHTLVKEQSGCRSGFPVYLVDEMRERIRATADLPVPAMKDLPGGLQSGAEEKEESNDWLPVRERQEP